MLNVTMEISSTKSKLLETLQDKNLVSLTKVGEAGEQEGGEGNL